MRTKVCVKNADKHEMSNVVVSQISTSKEMRTFVRFNYELYKNCPYAVPDLLEDTLETLDARSNPAFNFCSAAFFLAQDRKSTRLNSSHA